MKFDKKEIDSLIEIALTAGKSIMEIYNSEFSFVLKEDQSPLTLADKKSNEIIVEGLKKTFSNIPIISEESKTVDYSVRKNWNKCFIVDPLDGTKEFIKRNGEFTVNIAFVENRIPIIGIVYAPALNLLYIGWKEKGSFEVLQEGLWKRLSKSTNHTNTITIVASRSHGNEATENYVKELEKKGHVVNFLSSGSSLKFCLVASGKADIYPRFGPTMEWDTAAAHAVAKYAGCLVVNADSKLELLYNKEDLLNPNFIVQ